MTDAIEGVGQWRVKIHRGLPILVQNVDVVDKVRLDDVGKPFTMSEAAGEAAERNREQLDKWKLKREKALAELSRANQALALINSWGPT